MHIIFFSTRRVLIEDAVISRTSFKLYSFPNLHFSISSNEYFDESEGPGLEADELVDDVDDALAGLTIEEAT